jgi:hypothetical protein
MMMLELLHANAAADIELLRKNDALGDRFNLTRDVDFAFQTPDEARANDMAEFVNGKNYGRATVTRGNAGEFRILVVIDMPITQHLVASVSGFMACLSRLFQIEYDGWGSVVQK